MTCKQLSALVMAAEMAGVGRVQHGLDMLVGLAMCHALHPTWTASGCTLLPCCEGQAKHCNTSRRFSPGTVVSAGVTQPQSD